MPNPNDVQLNPPGNWEEFEDICADLFSREWNDSNVTRYGRQGQRQHGLDIFGKENGADVGAQCKRKGKWPPTTLTTAEVDEEVAEAKKFRPKLKKYIIATTASNDARIIDHVNALSAKHAKKGLFTRLIQDNVVRGDMPMVIASAGLRTTVVDIVLRNLIRNSGLEDARRKVAIPLFTGRRGPSAAGNGVTATFDITALLVLGWLGILPKAIHAYPRIALPAGALTELFEGRRRIRQTQRSRLRKAEEIRSAIANGQLKVLRAPALARDTLSAEIGIELAALLREAEATKGVVIRSSPVRRLGPDDREADLSAYEKHLCDMHGLLKTLVDLNAVDENTEKSASQYFVLQDRGWPASATPNSTQPIFLDGLTVVYLQTTGLLQTFLRVFKNVYIHDSTAEEAAILIENDKHVAEAFRVIDDIRTAIRAANTEGKVTFGPRRSASTDGDQDGDTGSTLNLLSDLCGADIAFFDDRFLNKETFAMDPQGQRAKTATTLDLIEELHVRGTIDEQERRRLRYRLRAGGAMLMPADADEIAAAARRNKQNESPEFRAIQDTIDLARLAEMPQFPSEMPWYLGFVHATKGAISRSRQTRWLAARPHIKGPFPSGPGRSPHMSSLGRSFRLAGLVLTASEIVV